MLTRKVRETRGETSTTQTETARDVTAVSVRVARKGHSGKALFEEGPGGEAGSHADS